MSEFSSFYLYEKYEKRGSQDWIPCYPNVYSISGDSSNPMTLVMKEENDPQCGYTPPSEPQYRWNVVDGFMCANCDQTKAMIHTSADTIYISGSGEITRAEVSGYRNVATDVVVTSDATSIGNNAFSGFSGVEFIRIPNSVTSIGDKAFYGCSAMTECQIPYGVLSVGNSAFTNSMSLMFVDIPSSVTSLGNGCFKNCANFRYASIPSSITNIPSECFYNCDGLSDIEIPSSVSGIGDYAFAQCSGLYSVTVNATTPPTIGTDIFFNPSSNLKIYVPCESANAYRSDSDWGNYSNRIYGLPPCDIPPNIKLQAEYRNGNSYSVNCNNNSTLTSGETRPYGFMASAMTSAEIGECVTAIGERAFYWCASLTSCTIGSGVTTIGNEAFYNCSGMTSINIPDNVTTIGNKVFESCDVLRTCTIGSGVTTIGNHAFGSCGLTSINIPDNVTSIGSAFVYCYSLRSATIGNGLTSIGQDAFYSCRSLTSCTIGSGVTSIGSGAFSNCSGMTSCTINATTPPTLGTNVFNNTNDCPIYVPSGSVNTYKSTSGWSDYASRIQAIT